MDNAGLLTPKGICASDDGRYLFVCDTGHHKVKFAALPGSSALTSAADMVAGVEMFTFAGNGKKAWRDGPVLDCSFNSPAGVWQCADGTVVVADTGNHCIRQILRTGTGNLVARTIAGGYQVASHEHIPENMNEHESRRLNKRHAGFRDGRRSLFRSPSGIVEGSYGELLVADTMNNCVRGLLPSSDGKLSWDVKTVCGIAQGGHTDGSCDVAAFSQPTSLNMGPHGTFFVSDRGNRCIRQVGGCHAQFSGSKNDCLSYSWVRTIEIGAVPRRLSQASRDIHAGCTSSSLECPLGILYLHDLRSSEPSAWTNSDRDEILAVCDGGSNVIEFIPIDSVSGEHNASSSMRQTLWDAHCPPSRAGRDAPVRSMLEECLSTKHDATTSNRPTAERRRSTRASSSQRYKSTFIPSCSMDRNPICRDILCSSDDISAFGGEDTSGNQSSEHPSQCICGNANAWKKVCRRKNNAHSKAALVRETAYGSHQRSLLLGFRLSLPMLRCRWRMLA